MNPNYDFSDSISTAALADYCRAIKLASTQENNSIYRTTGDRYFQDDGFMTHQEILEHIQWWNEQLPEKDHSDMWNSLTEVEQ
jgi:hypothetical protein